VVAALLGRDVGCVEISTLRWAIASFLGGVFALALGSIPLLAYCAGAGSPAFGHAALVSGGVATACLLMVVVALDLLGARARRNAPESGRAALPHRAGRRRAAHTG
jgi:hypothetical protein